MKNLARLMMPLLLASLPATATAQTTGAKYYDSSGAIHEAAGVFQVDAQGGPSVSRREIFALATANTPAAAVAVYGGTYILNQVCTTYGTVTFQALGPDGATYQTVATYSTATTTGGVTLALGSFQRVRVTLAGTAGCNIKLARVPA